MKGFIIGLALGAVLILGVAFTEYVGSGWTDGEREGFHQACVEQIDPNGRWSQYGFVDHVCDYYTRNMEMCFTPGGFSAKCLIK